MSIGDAAQDFLRSSQDAHAHAAEERQACWQTIIGLFKTRQPDEAQLARVSVVSEVAIDVVFGARGLSEQQCQEHHGLVKDYAECSALYSYVIGYNDALMALRRERELGQIGD